MSGSFNILFACHRRPLGQPADKGSRRENRPPGHWPSGEARFHAVAALTRKHFPRLGVKRVILESRHRVRQGRQAVAATGVVAGGIGNTV